MEEVISKWTEWFTATGDPKSMREWRAVLSVHSDPDALNRWGTIIEINRLDRQPLPTKESEYAGTKSGEHTGAEVR